MTTRKPRTATPSKANSKSIAAPADLPVRQDNGAGPVAGCPSGKLLSEANLLMQEGLKRIASAHTDIPGAQHPLQEALQMSEEQTMKTLNALESGRAALRHMLQTKDGYVDEDLAQIDAAFAIILQSQQAQDLAGQRLKKAMSLMTLVQERIAKALEGMPLEMPDAAQEGVGQSAEQSYEQDDVDALLAELGI